MRIPYIEGGEHAEQGHALNLVHGRQKLSSNEATIHPDPHWDHGPRVHRPCDSGLLHLDEGRPHGVDLGAPDVACGSQPPSAAGTAHEAACDEVIGLRRWVHTWGRTDGLNERAGDPHSGPWRCPSDSAGGRSDAGPEVYPLNRRH